MYNYIVQEDDLNILRQKTMVITERIELLNKNKKVMDSLEARIISDTFSCDGDSMIRRTYNCVVDVINSTFTIGADKKIWIDKYIRVYYKVLRTNTGQYTEYLLGTFSFKDMNYSFDAGRHELSLSCIDMMADYDGTKNGVMCGQLTKIPAGQDIRASVIALLADAGITDYVVDDIKKNVPHDLEFSAGTTYVQALQELCELYDSWEFFFDERGTFIWTGIPTGYEDPCVLDDAILQQSALVKSEELSDSFEGVYNATEVWGKVLSLENDDRYASASTYSNRVYSISLNGIASYSDIDNFTYLAIRISNTNLGNDSVSINHLANIPIVNDSGHPIAPGTLSAGTDYVFSYRRGLAGQGIPNSLCLLGQYQAHGYYEELSPSCPYSITNLGYKILHSLSMDHLYSDELCYNQAEYETYKTTAQKDTLTLSCIIIPFLEPHQKLEYTPKSSGVTAQYMVKSFSWDTKSGLMNLVLYRFSEDFSYVKAAKERSVT